VKRFSPFFTAALFLAFFCAPGPLRAQAPAGPIIPTSKPEGNLPLSNTPPSTTSQPRQNPAAARQPAGESRFRVQTNLVTAPVTVTDPSGELILNLSEKDFRIFDNGQEQKILHFDLGGVPLAIVFVVENSSRIEALLPAIRKSGIVFAQTVLGPTGRAAVLGVDEGVEELLPFSENPDAVQHTIENLQEGLSGLRLYDGLARAVSMLERQPLVYKRVILAVSEGGDSGSETKLGEVMRDAQLANITIYTIGLSSTAAQLRAPPSQAEPIQMGPPGTFSGPTVPGVPQTPSTQAEEQGNINLLALGVWLVQHASSIVRAHPLELATAATGGANISTFRDRSIEKALDQIGGELHAQYTLSYQPPANEATGYHEIKVTVSQPTLKVRTRPGYYIAPPEN
jgi:VWFA-related protein